MLSNADLLLLWDDARSFEQARRLLADPRRSGRGGRAGQPFRSGGEPSLFPLLRATPQLGRVFTDADAGDGAHRIVLLSHSTWTNRFRSDPDIVGAPVELNDEPHIIVGGTGQVALALGAPDRRRVALRSFVALVTVDLGFDPDNVVIARAADPARINLFARGGGRLEPEQIEAMNAAERRTTETLLLQMERV